MYHWSMLNEWLKTKLLLCVPRLGYQVIVHSCAAVEFFVAIASGKFPGPGKRSTKDHLKTTPSASTSGPADQAAAPSAAPHTPPGPPQRTNHCLRHHPLTWLEDNFTFQHSVDMWRE